MKRRHFLYSLLAGGGFALSRDARAYAGDGLLGSAARGAGGTAKKILFDSKGAQVEVNQQTQGKRLNTLFGLLGNFSDAPYTYSLSYPSLPLTPQLRAMDADVLIILTHQGLKEPSSGFEFSQWDLNQRFGIPAWVAAGGGLLLISNHGSFASKEDPVPAPFWPVNDAVLAAQFGITIVPAAFAPQDNTPVSPPPVCTHGQKSLLMAPAPTAPPALVDRVDQIAVWDACGIAAPNAEVVFELPADCVDKSGRNYQPADYCFCLAMPWGRGRVVVLSHSGIVGDQCTPNPSWGQISAADNLTFLFNAVNYVAGVA